MKDKYTPYPLSGPQDQDPGSQICVGSPTTSGGPCRNFESRRALNGSAKDLPETRDTDVSEWAVGGGAAAWRVRYPVARAGVRRRGGPEKKLKCKSVLLTFFCDRRSATPPGAPP